MKNCVYCISVLLILALSACHPMTVENMEDEREYGINPFHEVDIEDDDPDQEVNEAEGMREIKESYPYEQTFN